MLMSTRLQIVMSEEELASLRQAAARAGLTLSAWARHSLRRARDAGSGPTPESRLRALDQALACGHPTGDVDTMLADIETGRDLR